MKRIKKPKKENKLLISCEYLQREGVSSYVLNYCTRNNIPLEEMEHPRIQEPYWQITFKSFWQKDCFIRLGNSNYPYFEFH